MGVNKGAKQYRPSAENTWFPLKKAEKNLALKSLAGVTFYLVCQPKLAPMPREGTRI